jgi:hypothetical protein
LGSQSVAVVINVAPENNGAVTAQIFFLTYPVKGAYY